MVELAVAAHGPASRQRSTRRGALYAARRCLHVVDQRLLVEDAGPVGLDQRHHGLAEPFVGHTDHGGVAHPGGLLEHVFDLFRVHLLAGGVDGRRAPAEQGDHPVGVDGRPVAGDDVAAAVEHDERGRRLVRVAVVAQGEVPADGQPSRLPRTGRHIAGRRRRRTRVFGESLNRAVAVPSPLVVIAVARLPDSDEPSPSKIWAFGAWRSRRCLLSWLSIAPEEKMTRSVDRSQRCRIGVQLVQHRLGEGVADDAQPADAGGDDRVEQLDGVERGAGQASPPSRPG